MSSDKEKLDNLENILASGISSVKHEDQQVNYRSVSELTKVHSALSRKIKKKKKKQPYYSSGLR